MEREGEGDIARASGEVHSESNGLESVVLLTHTWLRRHCCGHRDVRRRSWGRAQGISRSMYTSYSHIRKVSLALDPRQSSLVRPYCVVSRCHPTKDSFTRCQILEREWMKVTRRRLTNNFAQDTSAPSDPLEPSLRFKLRPTPHLSSLPTSSAQVLKQALVDAVLRHRGGRPPTFEASSSQGAETDAGREGLES